MKLFCALVSRNISQGVLQMTRNSLHVLEDDQAHNERENETEG